MPARRRTQRDERRRHLGQNFLRAEAAEQFVQDARLESGELVLEIGPGAGAVTLALARCGVDVVAGGRARADIRSFRFPETGFRVVGSLPFGQTTSILARLLDDPALPLTRADLILQWEVARKRALRPPGTLRSAAWAPWWEFRLGPRIQARSFRPVPRVDGGVLRVVRRNPPLLPDAMAGSYARFVKENWPFTNRRRSGGRSARRR